MSHGDWNTPELRALRDTVTEFVRREVLPHQDEWEAAGELPRELSRTAGELGLLGVGFPEKAGGAKTFITSGCRADFVTTAVRTGGADLPGARGVSLLVIEKGMPGFEVSRKLDKMGWRSSDTAQLSFTDVRVPASHLVGPENTGFALIGAAFLSERIAIAAQAYSQAQRCLDLAADWCRARTTFGEPLISRKTVQDTLVRMAARIDVARTYTRAVVDRFESGEAVTSLIPQVCFAKNTATETGEWVAHEAVQLFGGMGYMSESEVERQYRDMRILGIGGGTVEIMYQMAARRLGYTQ